MIRTIPLYVIAIASIVWWVPEADAAANDWAEGTPGIENGASRDFYNRAGLLPWRNYMGDWQDANGSAQGGAAFAVTTVIDNDTGRYIGPARGLSALFVDDFELGDTGAWSAVTGGF